MPTIGLQMPKLFLRGSFVNDTIKNLTEDQQNEVAEIIDSIKDDPILQPTRYQFKNALRYTIKGDYLIDEAADQEYIVALWKAVVAAKFGWGEHGPSEETITNKHQRKKFFQTWVFNYLRQILNENRRSYIIDKSIVAKPTFDAAKTEVTNIVSKNKIVTDNPKEFVIKAELFMLPMKKIQELLKCKVKYISKNVEITILDDKVKINDKGSRGHEMVEVNTPTLVNVSSTSRTMEEGGAPEPALDTAGFNDPDSIEIMFDNVSEMAKEVLKIVVNPPADYVDKYGDKPVKRYIQEYLNLSPKQVKDVWSEMKLAYVAIIGAPD